MERFVKTNRYGLVMKYTPEVKELQEKENKEMLVFLYKSKMKKEENWERIKEEFK